MKTSDRRQKIFVWIVLAALALAVGYTALRIARARSGVVPVLSQGQGEALPLAGPEERKAIQEQPHLIFLHQAVAPYGQVSLAGLGSPTQPGVQTGLSCGRVYYAAGNGLCLSYVEASLSDPLSPPSVDVTLFGADFQPRHTFTVEGVLSRARISPDGNYAAYTVFVTGHGYEDVEMSTATVLLNTATGESLGNLEDFEVWKDGQLYDAPEFNFWGVTFAQDSNVFYATLKHGETTYLVQGDIAARKLTVLRENVECPSLSPDGTRIAYKKRAEGVVHRWQLAVLDLATLTETELAEKEGIDDQVEWLDNENILYQKSDYDPPKWVSVFVVPADGSGEPRVFLENATSPVVVR